METKHSLLFQSHTDTTTTPPRHARRRAASSAAIVASAALLLAAGAGAASAHPTPLPSHPVDPELATSIDSAHHNSHRLLTAAFHATSHTAAARTAQWNATIDTADDHAHTSVSTLLAPVYSSLDTAYNIVAQANADSGTQVAAVANNASRLAQSLHNPTGAAAAATLAQGAAATSNDYAKTALTARHAAQAAVDSAAASANQTIDAITNDAHGYAHHRAEDKQAAIDATADHANHTVHHIADTAQAASNAFAIAASTINKTVPGVAAPVRSAVLTTITHIDQAFINAGTALGAAPTIEDAPTRQ
ncbi:hypothetical protein ACGE24_09010 [Corynebacterium kroppenstedtii]|uniref:hypothetical protein n=1 Tax=Corynebacterium sp. PCR 32 TaxID=3351342 RepID=UPI0030B6ED0D